MTSFGVVARVRRILSKEAGRKIKVGHTGTLDPFATGLLILMSGKNTKKCQEFLKLDKVYEATLYLGKVSTTGDLEGEITDFEKPTNTNNPTLDSSTPLSAPSLPLVEKTIKSFIGEISQTLPKFSAIKINGKRAYKLARAGEDPKMPTRKITIYDIEILEYNFPVLKIRCHVSSGTYIRTLAEDIGKTLETGAYLTNLRRLKIGDYSVDNALTLADLGITD